MKEQVTHKNGPWSDAEMAYVADNLARGYSYGQIAWGLNRSRSAVASAIRRMREQEGEKRVAPAKGRSWASTDGRLKRLNLIADLLADEFSLNDIAQELGITYNAAKCAFKKIKRQLGPQAR